MPEAEETVTEEMIDAAIAKIPARHISLGHWEPAVERKYMRAALEAAFALRPPGALSAAERAALRQACRLLNAAHKSAAEAALAAGDAQVQASACRGILDEFVAGRS